ncbi:MAG: hypothetical protein ABI852_06555 [Gemmatimonadaceae bacterium]
MRIIAVVIVLTLCGTFYLRRDAVGLRTIPPSTIAWTLQRNGVERTRPTLIIYVTTTCPYCEELLKRIAKSPALRDSAESNSLSVLILSNKARSVSLPGLIPARPVIRFRVDEDGSMAESLHVSKVPLTISLQRNGSVAPATVGLLSQAAIDSLLKASRP